MIAEVHSDSSVYSCDQTQEVRVEPFTLGDSEFEQMITDLMVTDKLDELGLTKDEPPCSQELRWEPSVHYTMAQSFHHMHCFLQSRLPTWEM